jgi:hypothetical protein
VTCLARYSIDLESSADVGSDARMKITVNLLKILCFILDTGYGNESLHQLTEICLAYTQKCIHINWFKTMIDCYSSDEETKFTRKVLSEIISENIIQKIFGFVCDLKVNATNSVLQINADDQVLTEVPQNLQI